MPEATYKPVRCGVSRPRQVRPHAPERRGCARWRWPGSVTERDPTSGPAPRGSPTKRYLLMTRPLRPSGTERPFLARVVPLVDWEAVSRNGRAAVGPKCRPVVPDRPGRSSLVFARFLTWAPMIAPMTRAPAPGPCAGSARGRGGLCRERAGEPGLEVQDPVGGPWPALRGGGGRPAGQRCPLARAGLRRDALITARPSEEAVSIMPDGQARQRLFGWVRAAKSPA